MYESESECEHIPCAIDERLHLIAIAGKQYKHLKGRLDPPVSDEKCV